MRAKRKSEKHNPRKQHTCTLHVSEKKELMMQRTTTFLVQHYLKIYAKQLFVSQNETLMMTFLVFQPLKLAVLSSSGQTSSKYSSTPCF